MLGGWRSTVGSTLTTGSTFTGFGRDGESCDPVHASARWQQRFAGPPRVHPCRLREKRPGFSRSRKALLRPIRRLGCLGDVRDPGVDIWGGCACRGAAAAAAVAGTVGTGFLTVGSRSADGVAGEA